MLRFALLVFTQVLLLNNIHLNGLLSPYIYPLFILLLPFETPKWLVILLGFVTGLTVDFYSHTLGLHASVTTVTAFLRPAVIQFLKPHDGYPMGKEPRIGSMGFTWFVVYSSLLILLHHSLFFLLESFNLEQMVFMMGKIVASAAIAVALIIFSEYLFYKKKKALPA